MTRKAKSTCLAGGFLLVLLTVVWSVNHPRVVQAPHGQSVRLLHFDYGTSHFGPPVRWNQLRSRMPGWLLNRLGTTRTRVAPTPGPRLVLWLELGERRRSDGGRLDFGWLSESGEQVYPSWHEMNFRVMTSASGIEFDDDELVSRRPVLVSNLFPRRERVLQLQVSEQSSKPDRHPVGVLMLANPVFGEYPNWTPETLPAVREVQGLTVRLVDFEIVDSGWRGRRDGLITLEVSGGGERLPDWDLGNVALRDPTGNYVTFHEVGRWFSLPAFIDGLVNSSEETNQVLARFPWPGWSGEPVWEACLDLAPRSAAALKSTGGFVQLSGVPVPPKDGITEIGRTVDLAGYPVEVLALVGEHASYPGRPHDVEEMSTLELRVPDLPDGWRFVILEVTGHGGYASLSGSLYPSKESIGVRHVDTTREVDLTLAVYRIPKVRFRVGQ